MEYENIYRNDKGVNILSAKENEIILKNFGGKRKEGSCIVEKEICKKSNHQHLVLNFQVLTAKTTATGTSQICICGNEK